MGLLDRYKEVLKQQGINLKMEGYRPKKQHIHLILFLAAVAILAPSFFFLYGNYNSCSISASILSGSSSNSTTVNNTFSFKCATNFALYGAVTALLAAIILLLLLKILKARIKS